MKLTVNIARTRSGLFRASFVELPSIFYVAETEETVRERIDRLAHALESPHIKIQSIRPDGDVVLVLDRDAEVGEEEADCPSAHPPSSELAAMP